VARGAADRDAAARRGPQVSAGIAGADAKTAAGAATAVLAGIAAGALAMNEPGRAASAEKPQKAITGLASTT